MRSTSLTLIVPLFAIALCRPALGQHASFVLFGDPSPEAAEVPPERQFVHPITAPFFHEDSFVTSDLRAVYIYHDFPNSGTLGGGNAKAAAVQLRLALTKSLQLVAYKDGYINFDTTLIDDSGWMDLGAGLKWSFIQDWNTDFHMAIGVGYEFDSGNTAVLQSDDEWRFWGSVNKGFDKLHLGGTFNYFLADDKGDGLGNSDRISWHVHADYWITDWFSPVLEFNGYHSVDDGTVVIPESGVDVTNLGGGDDVVTLGAGAEFRPMQNIALRFAYETPLTDADQLFGYRWTFSLVWWF